MENLAPPSHTLELLRKGRGFEKMLVCLMVWSLALAGLIAAALKKV